MNMVKTCSVLVQQFAHSDSQDRGFCSSVLLAGSSDSSISISGFLFFRAVMRTNLSHRPGPV